VVSQRTRPVLTVLGLIGLAGCFRSGFESYPDQGLAALDGSAPQADGGDEDATPVEAGAPDAGRGDLASGDLTRPDTAAVDAARPDAIPGDATRADAGSEDVLRVEAGLVDVAPADAAPADTGAEDASAEDAGIFDPFVVSHTVLATGRYVELDVDWGRQLAYLSSQEPGVCFEVVDFSNPSAPIVIASLGPATVPATVCDASRGNQLFDSGTKLIVTSHDPGNLEIWDLGADPRVAQYQRLTSYALGHMRRVAGIDESGPVIDIHMCKRDGVRSFEFDSAGPSLVETGQWIGSDNQADAATFDLAFTYAFTASWIADAPIKVIRLSDMQEVQSFDMSNGVNGNGLWSVAVSSDNTRAFFGGWVSAFFSCGGSDGSAPCVLTDRFDNDDRYRDVVFVDEAGTSRVLVYAIRSDLVLDIFDFTSPGSPQHLWQHAIAVGAAEAYGLRVDLQTRRVVIVTTAGDFIIGDIDQVQPVYTPYPTF